MASYFMSSVVFSRAEGECKYSLRLIGERAKRARHSQVCSIENRIYIIIIIIMVRANIVLITRK